MLQIAKELRLIFQKLEELDKRQKEFLNITEAAWYLGMSKSTLYKHTSIGNITFYRPSGKLIVFKKEDLVAWLTRNKIPSSNQLKKEVAHD